MINKEILGHKNTNLGFEKHKFPTISPQDLEAGLQALQTEDPFKTLGVTEENTAKEINARYRDLMKKLHPDIVGDGAGDFLVVFNRMTQKITEAGAKLKDHCPPPKTLAEAVYQRLSQEDFEQKSAQDQLNLLVSRLYEYGVDTTSADITGGMESAYAIMNILQRAREHRLVIQRAYEGELGFQPLDNKPLPDLNEVLQLLKAARIYKSWRPKINEYHGVRMPSREQEAYFCVESIFVPHTERKPDNIPDWRYEASHINWISNFHEFNKLPTFDQAERLNRIAKQKQARIRTYGRFVGNLINWIKQPSSKEVIRVVVEDSKSVTTEKPVEILLLSSKNPD